MTIIEGRKYYMQIDLSKVVGRAASNVSHLVRDGVIEPPVSIIGGVKIWNERQYQRIKKQFARELA